ncbi:SAM-dependent methyltransferase, partial [Escherichia coli]
FGLSPEPVPGLVADGPDGALMSVPAAGLALIRALARRLVSGGGALLVVDYGHVRPGFGDTLQALAGHRFADPLAEPGEA